MYGHPFKHPKKNKGWDIEKEIAKFDKSDPGP
jgi:hypothetical protein